ncbi:MAG: hypothetical protein QXT33_06720 [Thermofilum sp.]
MAFPAKLGEAIGGEVRRALREEFDSRDILSWTGFLSRGVDAFFMSWARVGPEDLWVPAKPSDFWRAAERRLAATYARPKGYRVVSIRSIRSYRFGKFSLHCRPPKLGVEEVAWFGFETDDAFLGGVAHFRFYGPDGRLSCYLGTLHALRSVDVTGLLPSDYRETEREYWVAVARNVVEWGVDDRLLAVGVAAPNLRASTINGPPYAILTVPYRLNTAMRTVLDIENHHDYMERETVWEVSQWGFRVIEGSEVMPAVYRLYESGTWNTFAGRTVESGSLVSHPIPIFGYAGKTIYFQADEAGTLSLEVLTQSGNWREYDSVQASAGKLLSYNIEAEGVLARIVFTPSVYPCTVSEGEAVLR